MLVLSSPLCSPPKVCILGMHPLWKGKLRQTAPQNNSTPPRAPLGDLSPPLGHHCHVPAMLQCSHRGGSQPKRRCSFSHLPLCPSPPTPNASHGRAGAGMLVPPQLAQSCCLWGFHGAEHPSRWELPRPAVPQGVHTRPEIAPAPNTQRLAKRCWESSATLARVLWTTVGTSGLGDIKARLAAGTHHAHRASREPLCLSDPGGNILSAVSHARSN